MLATEMLTALLKRHEGKRLKPYLDTTGHLTIGYGRNLDSKGISDAEAEYLLSEDIADVWSQISTHLPWVFDLSSVRQAVLADMCFNLGIGGLLTFKKTLALVQAHQYAEASDQMLRSKWARQVKSRATRLSTMMRTGEWCADV